MLTINNTIDGAIQDIEIKGNTVQDPDNLSDIKSVGELQEDGTYKMSILSCGKNLFNPFSSSYEYSLTNGLTKVGHTTNEDGSITVSSKGSYDWGFVEYQNITVPKDITMSFIPNGVVTKGNASIWIFEANGTKICEGANTRISFISTTGKINVRLYVQTTTSYSDAKITYKPYLTEGTVATEYETYQENKCDILLPCQLEKVGDVSDRIICKDGVWGVEKNIKTIYTKEFAKGIGTYEDKGGTYRWGLNLDTPKTFLLTNFLQTGTLSTESTQTQVMLYNHGAHREFRIAFKKSDFPNFDIKSNVVDYLSNETRFIKIVQQPTFIPLPRNTQIALNSFFGTTHVYMESGEVEGTIKCKIPKSLGATVQSLNNKTDILSDRIEAIEGLKDSQNMKYETDKGYLVCKETKNGVIDDLKIEGKTLVNIHPKSTPSFAVSDSENTGYNIVKREGYIKVTGSDLGTTTYRYVNMGQIKLDMFKPNTTYTLVFTKLKGASYATLQDGNSQNPINNSITIQDNVLAYTFRTKETYVKSSQILYLWVDSNLTTIDIEVEDPMIFEGDLSANPPSGYIEGLKSVGEDVDKIEVLSVKGDGNLVIDDDINLYMPQNNAKVEKTTEGIRAYNRGTGDDRVFLQPFRIIRGSKITISFDVKVDTEGSSTLFYLSFLDANFNSIITTMFPTKIYTTSFERLTKTFDVGNASYIRIELVCFGTSAGATYKNIMVSNHSKPYTPHQSDKKQILYYNENGELEPIQELHEWDSIEKHSDNKWYYHKRSGKVVLNGSENWNLNVQTDSTIRFQLDASYIKMAGNRNPIICDKFNLLFVYDTNHTQEGVFTSIGGSTLFININKSKLSTQDAEGFKQWLQANNVTVVYQLAEEEVYELAPLHLDSYANETLILCNSGAISPKMEFSITSHINELVKAYGERINLLEEKVYQYMVTQNRMQLASTYSADSVTFKMDYFSLCGDEENYDEDLYNLILNNILVGKDNYNYDKMFTIILDYASWNQISWEQFDILVGLMDMQHNPPVEELPTEDIIEEDIIENEETPVE